MKTKGRPGTLVRCACSVCVLCSQVLGLVELKGHSCYLGAPAQTLSVFFLFFFLCVRVSERTMHFVMCVNTCHGIEVRNLFGNVVRKKGKNGKHALARGSVASSHQLQGLHKIHPIMSHQTFAVLHSFSTHLVFLNLTRYQPY